MTGPRLLGRGWHQRLSLLIRGAQANLVVCSPYVTRQGVDLVLHNLPRRNRQPISLALLTDLSPASVCQGATDPAALQFLRSESGQLRLYHLPRLHAKVYVADSDRAIITSANLTASGLWHNCEYGVELSDRRAQVKFAATSNSMQRSAQRSPPMPWRSIVRLPRR